MSDIEDGGLQFYQEVQQWRSQQDLEYEEWAELLDGEYWAFWEQYSETR